MENKELFEKKLTECGEIKVDISEVHNAQIKILGKLFKHKFGKKPKEFMFMKDLLYYKNGVPNEDSISRVSQIVEKFILMIKYHKFLGIDRDIYKILNNHGISIDVENHDISGEKYNNSKFEKLWDVTFNGTDIPDTDQGVLRFLLDESLHVKGTVENLKEEIKEEALIVESETKIGQNNFMKAVSIKEKKLKGKDPDLEKIIKHIQDLEEIINVV